MKNSMIRFTILALFGFLISCSTVKVVTDLDKTVDFSQYETYSFLGWQKDSDQVLNEFDKNRLHEAFKSEFTSRNLKYVENNGDMAISLFIVLNQKTSVTAYTDHYGAGGYGGYSRYGGGWGYGHSTTTYSENDYTEGTLVLDVFDSKTKGQIWQGVATATVTENPSKREKSIPHKVGALMKEFPVPVVEE